MKRLVLFAAAAAALTACDDRTAPAQRRQTPPASAGAEQPTTAAAHGPGTSVMRRSVIEETAPTTPPPAPPPPPRTQTVLFPSGSQLDEAGRAAVDAFVARLQDDQAAVVLRGHSDSQGSDAQNLLTSRHRAEAVAAYMVERGVAQDRITVIALGERRPIAPNANEDGSDYEAGRLRNRRVEIEVVPNAGPELQQPGGGGDQASESSASSAASASPTGSRSISGAP